jgi:mono/diheme cytochrome c family protein
MRRTSVLTAIFGATLGVALFPTVRAQAPRSVTDGVYTADQAKRGEMLYGDTCASCHDPKLIGGVGPALAGKDFIAAWKDKTVGDVFTKIKIEMPLTAPGTLTPEQTADVLSFILSSNQFPAGATALAADATPLNEIHMADSGASGAAPTATAGAAPTATAGAAPAGAAAGGGADAQAKRGEMVYTDNCAACHGPMLGGDIGPALAGPRFVTRWKEKSIADLFDKIQTTMPASAPGSLTPVQTADVVSFVLATNHYPGDELKPEAAPQSKAALGEPQK